MEVTAILIIELRLIVVRKNCVRLAAVPISLNTVESGIFVRMIVLFF